MKRTVLKLGKPKFGNYSTTKDCKVDLSSIREHKVITHEFGSPHIVGTFESIEQKKDRVVVDKILFLPTDRAKTAREALRRGVVSLGVGATILCMFNGEISNLKIQSVSICLKDKPLKK